MGAKIFPEFTAGEASAVGRTIVLAANEAAVRAAISVLSVDQTLTAISDAVADLIAAAPGALDTLNELAAALGDDANFAGTVTTALAGKAATVHTHVIGDTTGLQAALDLKVTGPASATDNAIARFDATTGKVIQNSAVTIDDSGNVSLPASAALKQTDAYGVLHELRTTLRSTMLSIANLDLLGVIGAGSGVFAVGVYPQVLMSSAIGSSVPGEMNSMDCGAAWRFSTTVPTTGCIRRRVNNTSASTTEAAVLEAADGYAVNNEAQAGVHLVLRSGIGRIVGTAVAANGGDVILSAGAAAGTGTNGIVQARGSVSIKNNAGSSDADLTCRSVTQTGGSNLAGITKAALLALTPTAASAGRWRVTDATPANREAYPDGTIWRYSSDDTIVV